MKLRVYLSLFSALAILTVSTGCIISHCTTPAAGGAPAAAVRPGLEQELKKEKEKNEEKTDHHRM